MPTPEISFLVRGPDGRCSTVLARTVVGAVKAFLRSDQGRQLATGSYVSVKARGSGSWADYQITR